MLIEEFDGEVPRTLDELRRAAGRRAQDRERRRWPSSASPRASSSTRTCSGCRSASVSRGRTDPVKIERDLDEARPARALDALPAPADLARPPRLHRAPAALRGVRARRSSCRLRASSQRDIRPPSSSYAGKKSAITGLVEPVARAQLELLVEPAHAPLTRQLRRVLAVVPTGERKASMTSLPRTSFSGSRSARTRPCGRSASTRPCCVADDEPGAWRRVVVVDELEQKAEPAAPARRRLRREALDAVEVDRAVLAVGTDEPGQRPDRSHRRLGSRRDDRAALPLAARVAFCVPRAGAAHRRESRPGSRSRERRR